MILPLVLSPPAAGESAREIVVRSISKDLTNWSLRKNYTYIIRKQEKRLDQHGAVKRTKSDAVEVSILYGEPYFRLVEKDGKPLEGDDARKEQEKLARFTAKRKNDTEEQKAQHLADFEKKRAKEREFLREVPEAYDLQLAGEATVDGKNTYLIEAEPRYGYRPRTEIGKYLPKIRGRIWIDKAEYQWVKVEAETTGAIAFGIFLFRLDKGARMEFEQARVNDEIWMPKRIHATGAGRVGLVVRGAYESDTLFENYRKFQSDSRIVSSSEVR